MRTWFRRLAYVLRQSRHEAELREEIELHRSLRAEQLERDGLTPHEAADASRRAIGNVLLAREDAREVCSGHETRGGRTCATACAPSAEARRSLPSRC